MTQRGRIHRLLIANRGEIAIRVSRAAAELGIETVAVFPADDRLSLHTRKADHALELPGRGAAAYLDIEAMVALAMQARCDAIHPGYGFLSENPRFARRCEEAGLTFVGPREDTLALFGDKTRARALAAECGVPIARGTRADTSLAQAREFLAALEGGAIVVKALAGGGGRGIRVVRHAAELEDAFARCASEARSAFGDGALYVEAFLPRARHIEVQVAGDEQEVVHLWERDCSLQRRNQKIVEIAPSPRLHADLRDTLTRAAVQLAQAVAYRGLGTFEFLVDEAEGHATGRFIFIEANARLQVEHTVTEEVTGIDLVKLQLSLAGGVSLAEQGLRQADIAPPCGFAIQARVNMETMTPEGVAKPAVGMLTAFEPPLGPGIRVDTYGYSGYATHPGFDSLLAKVIVHANAPQFPAAVARLACALEDFHVGGLDTNLAFLLAIVRHPAFAAGDFHTRFIEEHIGALTSAAAAGTPAPQRHFDTSATASPAAPVPEDAAPAGTQAVRAPMHGTVIDVAVREGDAVTAGQTLLVMDAMKMEHLVQAGCTGVLRRLVAARGATVVEGQAVAFIAPGEACTDATAHRAREVNLDHLPAGVAEVIERHRLLLDAARPEAIAKRHAQGKRSVRENIDDLCDAGSFVEYGGLVVAAQLRVRTMDELIQKTPADGLVTGIGAVNGAQFGPERSRCAIAHYDYTVLAGTSGYQSGRKLERIILLAEQANLPIIAFCEGGGARAADRPGDPDGTHAVSTFHALARMSGRVPIIGITAGLSFGAHTVFLGCTDAIIATRDASLGVGGPSIVEGGGMGSYKAEEIGPPGIHVPNGVIDLLADDEAHAVRLAQQYLSYFQGCVTDWHCADQRLLRHVIPENRRRAYDVHEVIKILADTGSVLELRAGFGQAMVTAFARIAGRPVGILANNPLHLGGAIERDGADKASRFMQLCEAYRLPLIFLSDNPGVVVGPEFEKTAVIRHAARMILHGANLTVPMFSIMTRKGYGFGQILMAGGHVTAPFFSVGWPSAELGGMGVEGEVKLGHRKELEAIADEAARQARFEELTAKILAENSGLMHATKYSRSQLDDAIDPADSRRWLVAGLEATVHMLAAPHTPRIVDAW